MIAGTPEVQKTPQPSLPASRPTAEIWSAVHAVLPEPKGYSAALLLRKDGGWSYSAS